MKKLLFILMLCLPLLCNGQTRKPARESLYLLGPNGSIYTEIHYPKGFDKAKGKYPVAVLMHGLTCTIHTPPVPVLRKMLTDKGYVCVLFDFDAHGRSGGDILENTMLTEIEDADLVCRYMRTREYARELVFLGHSQGGLIAAMLAARMEKSGCPPKGIVLLAPGTAVQDYARKGRFVWVHADPDNLPDWIQILWIRLGKKYLQTTQTLPIFELSAGFTGPVCMLQGTLDEFMPYHCNDGYAEAFSNCTYHVIPGEDHLFLLRTCKMKSIVADFLSNLD